MKKNLLFVFCAVAAILLVCFTTAKKQEAPITYPVVDWTISDGKVDEESVLYIASIDSPVWDTDEKFPAKLEAQPYFCLPHYRKLLEYGQKRLGRKKQAAFASAVGRVVNAYMDSLTEDVSWFCKKFDYRYDEEPWYNSKDAVERAIRFLRSDIHIRDAGKPGGKA